MYKVANGPATLTSRQGGASPQSKSIPRTTHEEAPLSPPAHPDISSDPSRRAAPAATSIPCQTNKPISQLPSNVARPQGRCLHAGRAGRESDPRYHLAHPHQTSPGQAAGGREMNTHSQDVARPKVGVYQDVARPNAGVYEQGAPTPGDRSLHLQDKNTNLHRLNSISAE